MKAHPSQGTPTLKERKNAVIKIVLKGATTIYWIFLQQQKDWFMSPMIHIVKGVKNTSHRIRLLRGYTETMNTYPRLSWSGQI